MYALALQVTALAPPKLLEKMSELLTQQADPSDRGFCSARLAQAMLPHLDEQEQASFHGVLQRLDTLANALIAKVGPAFPHAALQGSATFLEWHQRWHCLADRLLLAVTMKAIHGNTSATSCVATR